MVSYSFPRPPNPTEMIDMLFSPSLVCSPLSFQLGFCSCLACVKCRDGWIAAKLCLSSCSQNIRSQSSLDKVNQKLILGLISLLFNYRYARYYGFLSKMDIQGSQKMLLLEGYEFSQNSHFHSTSNASLKRYRDQDLLEEENSHDISSFVPLPPGFSPKLRTEPPTSTSNPNPIPQDNTPPNTSYKQVLTEEYLESNN